MAGLYFFGIITK